MAFESDDTKAETLTKIQALDTTVSDHDSKLAGTTPITSVEITAATVDSVLVAEAALAYAATTNIDFDGGSARGLSLTGDVTFTTSNKAAHKTVTLYISCDATPRTFTFPVGWRFVGAAAPSGIAASKLGVLTLVCRGTADSNVVAAYAEEP